MRLQIEQPVELSGGLNESINKATAQLASQVTRRSLKIVHSPYHERFVPFK
jgi:hypothetical protein